MHEGFKFIIYHIVATGKKIEKLRRKADISVKELQDYFGFESPQAIYKWQWGKCLPTIDNLVALATLFSVSIEDIIIVSELK